MDFTTLSNKELSEAIDFHRRQRNMSRGVNESAHMRQTQTVRLLEAEEARRLDEAELDEDTMPSNVAGRLSDRHFTAAFHHKKMGNMKGYAAHVKVANRIEDAVIRAGSHMPIKSKQIEAASDKAFKEHPHRVVKTEEVEQIDELSKKTLGSYVVKADKQADKASQSYSNAAARRHDFAADTPAMAKNAKKFAKRDAGSALAKDKLSRMEEVVINEGHYHVSWGGPNLSHTVMNAKSAEHAVASAKAHLIKKIPKLADEKYSDTFDKKPRVTNITNEEVSADTMKSAQKKASDSLAKPGPQGKTLPFNRFRSTNGGVNISAKNEEIEESTKSKMMVKLNKNVDPDGYHSSEDAEKHAHDINKHQLKMK